MLEVLGPNLVWVGDATEYPQREVVVVLRPAARGWKAGVASEHVLGELGQLARVRGAEQWGA